MRASNRDRTRTGLCAVGRWALCAVLPLLGCNAPLAAVNYGR
jgi:hypothetical protein